MINPFFIEHDYGREGRVSVLVAGSKSVGLESSEKCPWLGEKLALIFGGQLTSNL